MHSRNLEGWHGLAGWCFRRLPATGAGLWADDGGNSLPDAGSSIAAANLRLAELRSVSEIPGAAGFPRLLGAETRATASFGPRRAFQTDQARRAARRQRRVPVALGNLFPSSRPSEARAGIYRVESQAVTAPLQGWPELSTALAKTTRRRSTAIRATLGGFPLAMSRS